jgi:O-antigen ligase
VDNRGFATSSAVNVSSIPSSPASARGFVPEFHRIAAAAAVAAPALIAFNVPPSATFLNQVAALIGWAGWLMLLAAALPERTSAAGRDPGAVALIAALGLLALAALVAPIWTGLPSTLSLSAVGLLVAAMLTALIAVAVQRAGQGVEVFAAFCFALLAAGLASAVIGLVQVYAPELADGNWIAVSGLGDRAVGNLRQPNHLCSLLLWAMIATVWLAQTRRLPPALAPAVLLLLLAGVVLSASRTGMIGAALLALWGIADRRLGRSTSVQLWLVPVAYALLYALITFWAHQHNEVFGGEVQLHKSDISSSRFGIWANTLSLIAAHPWAGVGFGEFNFAWSLTPFPGRPVAFFDHTHNLPLHLAVELGLPLAALVITLLLWALYRAWSLALSGEGDDLSMRRAALVMVLMISLHSLLEYPLWYAYFLLPAVFAFGLCLGGVAPSSAAPVPVPRVNALVLAALVMMAGSAASLYDFRRVVVIFAPADNAAPLAQRIAEGRRSWFFGHHADYAAATTAEHPSQEMEAFERAPHYLLDTRIMIAWATALDEAGQTDRARHLAQRLREFRNPLSDDFFAACNKPRPAGAAAPFQCEPPSKRYDYTDFR